MGRSGSAAGLRHRWSRRKVISAALTSAGAMALLTACGTAATVTTSAASSAAPSTSVASTNSTAASSSPVATSSAAPATSTAAASSASTATSQAATTATASSAAPTASATTTAPTPSPNAVVFWSNSGYPYTGHVGAQLVQQFEQQGGPTIAYTDTVYADFMQKLLTTVAAGTPPDLSYTDRYVTQANACKGVIQTMDSMIAKSKVITKNMFFPRLVHDTNFRGKTYAIPHGPDVGLFYYNQDIFSAAGLDPAKPPLDWDTASTMAQKLTRTQGGNVQQVGWSPSQDWGVPWLVTYWQQGGEELGPDETKVTLNNAMAVNSLNYFKKVYDLEGGYDPITKFVSSLKGAEKAFIAGKVGMTWSTHSSIHDFQVANVSFKWNASYFPLPPNGQRANYMGGWSLVIPTGAKHAAGAFQFLEFLCQPAPQVSWAEEWNCLPSVAAVANSDAYLKGDPLRKLAVQDAGIAKWVIVAPGADQTLPVEVGIQAPVLTGQQTPEAELTNAQQKIQSILDQSYSQCSAT